MQMRKTQINLRTAGRTLRMWPAGKKIGSKEWPGNEATTCNQLRCMCFDILNLENGSLKTTSLMACQ